MSNLSHTKRVSPQLSNIFTSADRPDIVRGEIYNRFSHTLGSTVASTSERMTPKMQLTSIIKDVSWAIVLFTVPGYLIGKDSKGTTVDTKYFQFAHSVLYIFSVRKCTQL